VKDQSKVDQIYMLIQALPENQDICPGTAKVDLYQHCFYSILSQKVLLHTKVRRSNKLSYLLP